MIDRAQLYFRFAIDSDSRTSANPEPESTPVQLSDAAILLSVPGIGTTVLATLLAEGSDALQR